MHLDTPVGGAPRLGLGPAFCEWVLEGPLGDQSIEYICLQLGFSSQHWRAIRSGKTPVMSERIGQFLGILQREYDYPAVLIVLDPATMRSWIQPTIAVPTPKKTQQPSANMEM